MTELDEHVVARLQTVIYLLPSALIEVGTAAATRLGSIHTGDLLRIENSISLRAPAPHAILFLVSILYGTVASKENHWLALLALKILHRQSHIDHHRLQRSQTRILTLCQSLCSRTGIHHRSETGGVDMVLEEMILLLPMTITVEFGGRNLVQIYERNALLLCHLLCPQSESLIHAHNLIILIIGITRSERHQDRMSTERLAVVDILAHILAVGIDGLLHARLLDGDIERILADARDAGTRTTAIVRTVIIMTDRDDHPVASLDSLAYIRPETVVESTATHASERLIFYRNLILVKELMFVVAPAPLAVVTIAERTVAHGRVAYQEEYRIVALSAGSRNNAGGHRLVETVHCIINHMIHIFHRTSYCGLCLLPLLRCLGESDCCCRHQRHCKQYSFHYLLIFN